MEVVICYRAQTHVETNIYFVKTLERTERMKSDKPGREYQTFFHLELRVSPFCLHQCDNELPFLHGVDREHMIHCDLFVLF